MSLSRGEKVAFLGRNGEGKTTFSKIIAGKLDFTGSLTYGHQVNLGYYAQDQAESLDGDKTVLQTIDDAARGEIRGRIREILGSFLFSGDSVDKKVKVLSGGERARLALAKLLLEPYNLLVLDEPTNHLDMRSKDILKQALLRYDGAMVLVSHDRDFLKGLSTKVFEFRDGQVFEHIGDVYEFLAKRKLSSLDQLSLPKQEAAAKAAEPPKQSQHERQRNMEQDKDLRRKQNRLAAIEEEISALEKKVAQMGSDLADPERYQEALKNGDPYKIYNELEASLQAKMEEWEILTAEIEKDAVG
jgi:ATP-binding cassette subfamily F protein 3